MLMAEQLFATKGNLISAKKTLSLCQLGYELLDRKRNVLIREMMSMINDVKEINGTIEKAYADAYAALQTANITLGVTESFADSVPEDNGLSITSRSVMGVELPQLELKKKPLTLSYGLFGTNSQLDIAYIGFERAKELTVKLAEIETGIFRLAYGIKRVQRSANSLKNIMIPRYTEIVKTISDSLEEKEREEFSQLKVIKAKKLR